MYPSNLNFLPQIPSTGGQSLLQALHAQQQQMQYQSGRDTQQTSATNGHRQQAQIPSTTASGQNLYQQQQMAYMTAIQQLSQEQNKSTLLSQLNNPEVLRMHPQQQLQMLQNQLNSTASAGRPSLMSNFLVHGNTSQLNNMIKQEPKQVYGLTTGVPYRSANLSVQNSLTHTPEVTTSPAPNRANNLLSNIHAAQSSSYTTIDGPAKQERLSVRDRIDKVSEDHKQLEAQFATVTKRRQHLQQMLENRKIEMRREREEAAAAMLRAAVNAEDTRCKVPLAERIAIENRQQADKNSSPPITLLPSEKYCHNLNQITKDYKKFAPILIRVMTESKIRAQKKCEEYLSEYEEEYTRWLRRVEKFEKTPKKIARDQKNRELFEKMFPEIKKDREERERNERHERNSSDDILPKSKEEKAAERACHVPFYRHKKPRHEFINKNNEVDEQQLKNVNDDISTFLGYWTPAERNLFLDKIKLYWKNFHVLSHFYWDKTACDMVKFFYATKSEIKYKLTFPKVKKKVAKAYKPAPLPDFREMYDQLMLTCDLKNDFQKLACIICSGDVPLFGSVLPRMREEKEDLRQKILQEQDYREKMPICNKCYSTYKKPSLRCTVGDCGNGRRRNKPSRALPTEFLELSVQEQSLIVRKLQFHPGTPKICANCHKRIQNEVKNIKCNTFIIDPAAMMNRRPLDKKRQLKWTNDRVEALFRAVSDSDKSWDVVSLEVSTENFKPSPRQCKLVFLKLNNYWRIKSKRVHMERFARRLRRTYRKIRRTAQLGAERGNQKSIRRSIRKDFNIHPRKPPQGSITQGIPVSRTPVTNEVSSNAPLLANFIPTTSQHSNSASPSILNQIGGIQSQLMNGQMAQYLAEEFGLPKENSTEDNAAEIAQRISLMSPYEFERMYTRLKARTQQDRDSTNDRLMGAKRLEDAHLNASSVLQYSSTKSGQMDVEERQIPSTADRPNRKTGLANVMLESGSSFRSRSNTLQKNTINRPSTTSDGHPIKTEPIDPVPDAENLKLKQSRALNSGSYQRPIVVEEPAYESLSDDDYNPKDPKEFASSSSASHNQKSNWEQLYTIFNLTDHERSSIPPCPKSFIMPAIESLNISSRYEDLSD